MQLAQSLTPIGPLENLAAVEQLVSESLFGDWVIQIEHSDLGPESNGQWSHWGGSFFGSKDLGGLTDGLLACRVNNPTHAIRLNAQKLRPYSRLVYWVFQPEEAAAPAGVAARASAVGDNRRRKWPASNMLWRYGALAGFLAVAALVFESVAVARLF